jgi:hypothetical protein
MPGRSTAGHFAQANAFATRDPRHAPADAQERIDGLADDADWRDGSASQATHQRRTGDARGCASAGA